MPLFCRHWAEKEGNQPVYTRPTLTFCLFCGTITNHGDGCDANEWNDLDRLPAEWEVRPNVTEEDHNRFWSAVHQLAASEDPDLGRILLELKAKPLTERFSDFAPAEVDGHLKETGVGSLNSLRTELDRAWTLADKFQDDYVLDSQALVLGIQEIDNWLEWYLPTSRGHLAKTTHSLVRRYPLGSLGRVRGGDQAFNKIMKALLLVLKRYPYDDTQHRLARWIVEQLVRRDHTGPARTMPELYQDLISAFRRKNIPGLLPKSGPAAQVGDKYSWIT